MATFVSFWSFLEIESRMANLGLIDFKLGFLSKLMVMLGKTNLKLISLTIGQNGHQLVQHRPDATFGQEH